MQLPGPSEVGTANAAGQRSCNIFRAALGAEEHTTLWHWASSPGMAWKGGIVGGCPFCGALQGMGQPGRLTFLNLNAYVFACCAF